MGVEGSSVGSGWREAGVPVVVSCDGLVVADGDVVKVLLAPGKSPEFCIVVIVCMRVIVCEIGKPESVATAVVCRTVYVNTCRPLELELARGEEEASGAVVPFSSELVNSPPGNKVTGSSVVILFLESARPLEKR